jgi:dTDP-4-dehydrorhamnose 3,5-epimerase
MKIEKTTLEDCYIIHPTLFEDERGYFYEKFNKKTFFELTNVDVDFVQDNEAKSNYGVIRGLHFQKDEHAQAKLVSVIKGKVLDVVVDCRENSATYMKVFSIELSAENKVQLFVPRGFAHGYSVLEDETIFYYKCDNYYCKTAEGGLYLFDEKLNIDWQIPIDKRIVSEKDEALKN